MGRYNWGYKTSNMVYKYTSHEALSSLEALQRLEACLLARCANTARANAHLDKHLRLSEFRV